jgi:oligopeptide transport system substrate-binding protein
MTTPGPNEHPSRAVARRAFLRGTVGAGGVAMVSLLAACGGGAAVTGSASSAGTSSASSAAPATTAATTTSIPSTASASVSSIASTSALSSSAASTTSSASAASAAATTSSATSVASTSSAAAAATSSKAASVRTDIPKMATAQTVRINLGGEPDAIDPNVAEFTNEIAVVRQVFDALVLLDKDLKPVAGGAKSWTTSSDGLTWTFTLQPQKWSDGTAVKAADYEYSFKRILDPAVAAPYAGYFAGVIKGSSAYNSAVASVPKASTATAKPTVTPAQLTTLRDAVGVKATDDSTLVFTLEGPTPFFLDLVSLAVVPPVRQDLVKDGWTNDVKNYVGNGPFVLLEHHPQDQLLFAPNPNYYGGPPKVGLQYRIITDGNAAYAAYRNDELDIVVPPRPVTPSIKADPTLSKQFVVNPALSIFWMYLEVKKPPLNNVKLRQALSQAFDRDSFIRDQFKGLGAPATFVIPKGMPGYDPQGGAEYAFDLTKAKASLQASGVDPASVNLKILYTNNPVTTGYASYIQAMMKKNLGVNLQPNPVESKARVAAQKAHNFDLVWSGWNADYPDPQDWFDLFRTGDGNNNGEYSNPQYDALIKQADAEMDATKRADLYKQAAAILYADQPVLIMYQDVLFGLVKPWVQGIVYTAQDEAPAIGDYFYKSITLASH